jgi:SAM-dependent methyltransferase
MKGLQPAEEAIISLLKTEFRSPSILDLGVGAGRTSEGLAAIAGSYVGLDYSSVMVDICKERYPRLSFVVGDARDLRDFADSSLDIVFFSYNGIDCVGPEDRLEVFRSVRRVLRPHGVFVHSSHNLEAADLDRIRNPYDRSRIKWSLNPVKFARSVALYVLGIAAHRRLKGSQKFGVGWAVLNEQTNRFRELMYYVTPQRQAQELLDCGLELRFAYGRSGQKIDSLRGVPDSWVYYVSGVKP